MDVPNNGEEEEIGTSRTMVNNNNNNSNNPTLLNLIDFPTITSPPFQQNNYHYKPLSEEEEIKLTTLTLGFPCYHKDFNPLPQSSLSPSTNQDSHPLYPWAKVQPGKVHSLEYLLANGIFEIKGQLKCNECKHEYEMRLDLVKEFNKVKGFIVMNKHKMYDRAPAIWKNPPYPTCPMCEHRYSVRPVLIDGHHLNIDYYNFNWLFLLLTQFLESCTLYHLKYFLMVNQIHRTGAKDRLLYLAYLNLCKQLDPSGPFDR
ncbi:hypothetical protein CsatA_022732 [Cannabis sativa]